MSDNVRIRRRGNEMSMIQGLLSSTSLKSLQKDGMNLEYLFIDEIIPNEKNKNRSMNEIERLAQEIFFSGLEQPLVVRQDKDTYLLLSGHRRLAAIQLLRSQGKWNSDKVPCIVKELAQIELPISEDLKETLSMLVTNSTRKNTTTDIAEDLKNWTTIFTELRNQGVEYIPMGIDEQGCELQTTIVGKRTRTLVSEATGIGETQVGQYEKVEKQGSQELKEALKNEQLSVGVASEIATLPEEAQTELLTQSKDVILTKPAVAKFKEQQQLEPSVEEIQFFYNEACQRYDFDWNHLKEELIQHYGKSYAEMVREDFSCKCSPTKIAINKKEVTWTRFVALLRDVVPKPKEMKELQPKEAHKEHVSQVTPTEIETLEGQMQLNDYPGVVPSVLEKELFQEEKPVEIKEERTLQVSQVSFFEDLESIQKGLSEQTRTLDSAQALTYYNAIRELELVLNIESVNGSTDKLS